MPYHSKNRIFSFLVLLLDVLSIFASFVLTFYLRFHWGIIPLNGGTPNYSDYFHTLYVIVPVYLLFFRSYGLYSTRHQKKRIEEIFAVVKAVTFSIFILMALTFFYRDLSYSRIYLVTLWISSIFLVSFNRYLLIQYAYERKVQHKDVQKVLLIGTNPNARQIIHWAKNNPHYGKKIVGILTDESELLGKHFEEVSVIGFTSEAENFIQSVRPDEIILLDTEFGRERTSSLVDLCEEKLIDFKIGVDIYGLMTRHVNVEYLSTVPLLGFRELPLDDLWNRSTKRVFDVFLSGLILFATLPLWLIVILLIKLTDHGPIFYAQERVGRDEKNFHVYKFRTMQVDAEKETGPVWTKADDQRRTAFGSFLRRWNIDEIPQLLNVLKGDMSLVGPRPERPHFVNQFRTQIPHYMTRHKIKSGLTGWAQVNGLRGNTSIEERIKYDLYYMENWSLILDIEIMFMTFLAFKNAY